MQGEQVMLLEPGREEGRKTRRPFLDLAVTVCHVPAGARRRESGRCELTSDTSQNQIASYLHNGEGWIHKMESGSSSRSMWPVRSNYL